jgi:hypothetical protein
VTTADDLWPQVRDLLPDAEELAADVAAEVGEGLDDVRPTVLIGAVARDSRPAPDVDVLAALEAERSRVRAIGPLPPARLLDADSPEELLAETRRLAAAGALDLATIVAIQRTSGAIAARTDRRLVLFLARYGAIRHINWERCVAAMRAGRLDPDTLAEYGRYLFLWSELTSLVVTDGYRTAERDILARNAEARRSALQELLGVVATDATTTARLRRVAVRYGLNPDQAYRLVAIAPRPEADPTPDRPGIDQTDLDLLASRIGHLLGSMAPGAEGVGAGIRLPAVFPLNGRIAVLAREDWAGLARVPEVLDTVLGSLAAAATPTRRRGRAEAVEAPAPAAWVAVGSPAIAGATSLAATYADLVDATRTARTLGLRGWIPDPERLAIERLLLQDRALADAAIRRELGPLLDDERMGAELVATLQAYFDAGENMREAGRRLHLATRTVAYRLQRVETLLGGSIDMEARRRLGVALMAYRLRAAEA